MAYWSGNSVPAGSYLVRDDSGQEIKVDVTGASGSNQILDPKGEFRGKQFRQLSTF